MADSAPLLKTLWTRHSRWWPWLVLVVGFGLTWQQHEEAVENDAQLLQVQFDTRIKEMVLGLEQRLQSNTDLLRGVAGLFTSSDDVSREEFSTYVRGLQLADYYPGISGVGFSGFGRSDQIPALERHMRHSGIEGYKVHPAVGRPTYTSIVYLEPYTWRNERAMGYDMYSEPVRAQAMKNAVESGQATVSGKVRLLQEVETDVQAGFLLYVPIYVKGASFDNAAARWKALQGWAFSPIRAGDLVKNHLRRNHPRLEQDAIIAIYAGPTARQEDLLYRTPDDLAAPRTVLGAPDSEELLRVLGQQWLVEGYRRSHVASPAWKPEVLWIGGLLTALLASLVHVANRSNIQVAQALKHTLQANAQLARNEEALRLAGRVMAASPLAIVVTDPERRMLSVNPAFERITGYTGQQVMDRDLTLLLTERQLPEQQHLWETLQHEGSTEAELDGRRQDGSIFPAALTVTQVNDDAGRCSHLVVIFQDITERRKADERIRHLAHHDYLTGLPNRATLVDRATQALLAAQRYGLHPAVLFMDLDRFKPINDTYGHDAGDAVLIEVACRLKSVLRETDLICRQGGDEFVVLLPDHTSPQDLLDLAQKLVLAIQAPYDFNGTALALNASIGIAMYPEHGTTVDDLIQAADTAMYAAKQDHLHRVAVAMPPSPAV